MSSTSKACCFAHYHLTPEEHSLWVIGMDLSFREKRLFFDGRKMVARYCAGATTKSSVYRTLDRLVRKGWFRLLQPRTRNKYTGRYYAAQYRVLNHAEWVGERGAKNCRKIAPSDTEEMLESPVPLREKSDEITCPTSVVTCPTSASEPVPPVGHNPMQTPSSNIRTKSYAKDFRAALEVLQEIAQPTPLVESTHKPEAEAVGNHPTSAASPTSGTGPVPPVGQVGPIPPVSPPVPKQRKLEALTKIATAQGKTVEALLSEGTFLLEA